MKMLKDYILDVFENSLIFEMAYARKEIKQRVESLTKQIIENWCLVKYCSLYDVDNINLNHWKKELMSHLYNIFEMKLKGGNNKSKYDLIAEIIFEKKEITNSSKIEIIVRNKFRIEQLPLKKDVCDACIEDLNLVIELISADENPDNSDKIFDYIQNL